MFHIIKHIYIWFEIEFFSWNNIIEEIPTRNKILALDVSNQSF